MDKRINKKNSLDQILKRHLPIPFYSDFRLDDDAQNWQLPSSPWRILIILTITVFIMELAIMVGIEFVISPEESHWLSAFEAIFDAVVLTIVVFPVLYRYSYRPLVMFIKDHQRMEKDLKASNDLLENTFASLSDVVLVVDMPERNIITCNQAVPHVLGYEIAELVGESMVGFFAGADHYHRFLNSLTDAFANGRYAYHTESSLRHKNGQLLTTEITVTQIKGSDGRTTSQVIVIHDITHRKQTEAQLARNNQELKTLSQLGQTVVSSLSLETIFDHLISRLMPLLDAECFSILLVQDDHLTFVANGGVDTQRMLNQKLSIHEGIYGQIMRRGEPLFISGTEQPAHPLNHELDQICYCGPQTVMAVPLKVENQIIGIIQAAHRRTDVFSESGLQILQASADWAAIAISHARQHEEIQRRLKETATLAAITQSLNETLDLDNILQLIADSAPKLLLNADRVVIHLLKEDENLLYPAIWSGQSDLDTPALYMNADEGIAGQALKTGKLINLYNVEEDPNFLSLGQNNIFKSLMVAPLQSGRTQLGTISVHNAQKEGAFSASDEKLLIRLADSAAITISTANLYQAERKQRQFAEMLVQAAAALSMSLRLNEIVQTVLDQTLRIVSRCEKATIYLLQDDKVYLTRSTDDQPLPPRLPDALHRIFVQQEHYTSPPSQLVAATGKPILIVETNNEPSWPNEEGADWLKSFVAAPLRIRNEIFGFLNVHSTRPGAFDRETIRQVEALAAHASLAIQNAKLFNELRNVLQTEQSTRAQLVQAQKLSAMGRMVASVAHELNNPLQTIKNCLYLIQYDVPEDAEGQSFIEMALSETQRLTNLVMQLREVYRPGGSSSRKPVSLPKLVDEVHILLKPHLEEHHVNWYRQSLSEDFVVWADANQLKQVLLNICLNAIEAIQPKGGSLTLDIYYDPESAEIALSIQDDGPGIPADEIAHLFEPFFTTKESGTGLGLAICYDIVQSHGGHIEVKSILDQGANFIVWLPAVSESVSIQEA